MSDTPETDAAIYPMNEVDIVWPEFARKLERDRDEAREHIERQRLEIVRLNGATNHAGGTPLKIALRERDEWAAMCGQYKQERDEAITRRMETIMQCELYEQERDEARELAAMWKANHDNQVALKAMLMERPDLCDRASRIAELIRDRDEAREETEYYKARYEQLKERPENPKWYNNMEIPAEIKEETK